MIPLGHFYLLIILLYLLTLLYLVFYYVVLEMQLKKINIENEIGVGRDRFRSCWICCYGAYMILLAHWRRFR